MLLIVMDWVIFAYLLIVSGGVGTTICLYIIGRQPNPDIRRRVDYLELDVKELKEREKENKQKNKDDINKLYKQLYKIQKKNEE